MSNPPAPTPPPPYFDASCIGPPYNATNFNSANSTILSTLQFYASNSPNYPWATGTDAQQIYTSRQNITYFHTLNQQTQAVKAANGINGSYPYPVFKSDRERLMYIQGMALTSARNQITGRNPSAPAGVPCSTIYQIINS